MSQVLLLDQGFQAIKTISWQRAVTLLTLNKVELVETYDGFIRSATLVIKMPAVVRLLTMFRRHKRPVKFSRISIYARDNYSCQYCGDKLPMDELTYDHVVPRTLGGTTTWTNIVSCCSSCNSRKAGRTPAQASMKLLKQPIQPKWQSAMEIKLAHRAVPQEWASYLYWAQDLIEG